MGHIPASGEIPPAEAVPRKVSHLEVPEQKDLEILGRQRPPMLSTPLIEFGFVFAIVLSMTMAEYTISGFNIVLPAITESLAIPESGRTWPASVTNLTTGCLLLPCARFCDRYGGKAVFLAGHTWLLIWSIACGFSRDATVLTVCRAMQGLGSAAFLPAGIALLGRIYRPGPRKNLIFGIYGACACVGFYVGILVGAATSELLDWRWYFWIGACVVATVAALGFLTIPAHLGDSDPDVRMDWWGLCTIVPGLVLVTFAVTDGGHAPGGWKNPYIFITFIAGFLFLCAAVYVQGWVSTAPLLPAAIFRPKYMKRLMAALWLSVSKTLSLSLPSSIIFWEHIPLSRGVDAPRTRFIPPEPLLDYLEKEKWLTPNFAVRGLRFVPLLCQFLVSPSSVALRYNSHMLTGELASNRHCISLRCSRQHGLPLSLSAACFSRWRAVSSSTFYQDASC